MDLGVPDQGIDTSTPIGRMFFQFIGSIAEFERALMSERTRDGLSAARARGRTGGQKTKLGPRQLKPTREMHEEQEPDGKRAHTVEQIAKEFPSVEKAYAIQAGREIRAILRSDMATDEQMEEIARTMAIRIEKTMDYPGQIKVTCIRESRAIEYAR